METPIRTDVLAAADAQSAVSWASIAARAVVEAASSLGLLALGVGLDRKSLIDCHIAVDHGRSLGRK